MLLLHFIEIYQSPLVLSVNLKAGSLYNPFFLFPRPMRTAAEFVYDGNQRDAPGILKYTSWESISNGPESDPYSRISIRSIGRTYSNYYREKRNLYLLINKIYLMGVYNEASCVINVWNSKVNSTDPASLS